MCVALNVALLAATFGAHGAADGQPTVAQLRQPEVAAYGPPKQFGEGFRAWGTPGPEPRRVCFR
jgi:hypothetical protein